MGATSQSFVPPARTVTRWFRVGLPQKSSPPPARTVTRWFRVGLPHRASPPARTVTRWFRVGLPQRSSPRPVLLPGGSEWGYLTELRPPSPYCYQVVPSGATSEIFVPPSPYCYQVVPSGATSEIFVPPARTVTRWFRVGLPQRSSSPQPVLLPGGSEWGYLRNLRPPGPYCYQVVPSGATSEIFVPPARTVTRWFRVGLPQRSSSPQPVLLPGGSEWGYLRNLHPPARTVTRWFRVGLPQKSSSPGPYCYQVVPSGATSEIFVPLARTVTRWFRVGLPQKSSSPRPVLLPGGSEWGYLRDLRPPLFFVFQNFAKLICMSSFLSFPLVKVK